MAGIDAVRRRLSPYLTGAFTSARTRDARRFLAERRRRRRGEPHRVHYFHQADDPYSQLAAQLLAPLASRFDVAIEPHLVGPPPDEAAPERARLEAYARKDAADVAPGYGLSFPAGAAAPVAADVELATRILAGALPRGELVALAPRVGAALWAGDRSGLETLARETPPAEPAAARAAVQDGSVLRERLGHYLGAMLLYGGEWYWGVDRLTHLERRLEALGARRPGAPQEPLAARPDFCSAPPVVGSRRLTLEYFPSLRSPYSYISMERVFALPARLPVDLVLRPVLPMVMRGLPVPRRKQLYIVLDTKREADDAGVPFGFLSDPVGRPVERALSLFPWASKHGRGAQLLHSFSRAAFAEGVDTGRDAGLRRVVERAGLSWEEAQRHVDGEGWRDEIEANRAMLLEAGLWGVPSFRLLGEGGEPDFCSWGADRIWLVESEIRRRLGAPPLPS